VNGIPRLELMLCWCFDPVGWMTGRASGMWKTCCSCIERLSVGGVATQTQVAAEKKAD